MVLSICRGPGSIHALKELAAEPTADVGRDQAMSLSGVIG